MDVLRVQGQCEELELILESLRRPLDLRTRSILLQKFKDILCLIGKEFPADEIESA